MKRVAVDIWPEAGKLGLRPLTTFLLPPVAGRLDCEMSRNMRALEVVVLVLIDSI